MSETNSDDADHAAARRMRTVIMLHNSGVDMMWQRLKRKYPDETDQQRAARLRRWLGYDGFDMRQWPGFEPRERKSVP